MKINKQCVYKYSTYNNTLFSFFVVHICILSIFCIQRHAPPPHKTPIHEALFRWVCAYVCSFVCNILVRICVGLGYFHSVHFTFGSNKQQKKGILASPRTQKNSLNTFEISRFSILFFISPLSPLRNETFKVKTENDEEMIKISDSFDMDNILICITKST